jgi:putative PIN family toxin of toxin-antitoxin system
MDERVVVDTSVMIAALISGGGGSRAVLRLCLRRRCQALMGAKLFTEYEDVFGRTGTLDRSPLSPKERGELLDAFLGVCQWTPVFFLWRPNLPDEQDNHLIELAVAGGAGSLITHNVRDFRRGELRFPQLRIETPGEFLKRWRTEHGDDDD